jgi:chaperonin GroEL
MLENNKYQDLIYYNEDALSKLKSGVDKIVNAVKVTLGPYGRNVIFDTENGPVITKDGVSVSNYIRLIDPIENMSAEILKQVSRKTVDDVGDGTTTSMVLTQSIINNTDVKNISNIFRY